MPIRGPECNEFLTDGSAWQGRPPRMDGDMKFIYLK